MPNLSTKPQYILTADIGGSHITSGICNMQTQGIIAESIIRLDVMCQGTAEDILTTWTNAIKKSSQKVDLKISGLALAMPGPFDYVNGISYIKNVNKYDSLYGIDVRQYLSENLNIEPANIKFRNDAEAILTGEVLGGAGADKDIKTAIGLTLGTGVGSAYYSATETADMNLYCIPFKDGIADEYFSTRWFQKRYSELTEKSISGVRQMIELEKDTSIVKQIFGEFTQNLSTFMETYLTKLKPDMLILGGNIAKAANYFLPQLKTQLKNTTIQIATLGENAALVGAADLLKHDTFAQIVV